MNHYEVLGLKRNATQDEIREAYKKLIKKYHPDLYQGDKTFAEKKTQSINVAYDILSVPEKRKQYDDEITPNYDFNHSYTTNTTNYNYNNENRNNYANYTNDYNNSKSDSYRNNYSYDNYHKNRASQYSTFDDFYQRHYGNFRTSNKSNSNYTNYSNRKSFFETIFKTGKQQIIAIIIIFLIYFITLLSNINQFTSNYKNSIAEDRKSNNNSGYNTSQNITSDFYIDYEDFDINDYFTDEDLLDAYHNTYSTMFDSFEEFKEAFSQYVYVYLNSNYYPSK